MKRSIPTEATRSIGPALCWISSALGGLWYADLMRGPWAAAALGPVCHHGGPLALHCPSCYAALAVMALGAFGGLTLGSAPRTVRARAR